jgi:hypothetical protein
MSGFGGKSNQQKLDDMWWLLANPNSDCWFYRHIAESVLTHPVPLAGGGTTTLATKISWQAHEFRVLRGQVAQLEAQHAVLLAAINALAEASNADAEEIKNLLQERTEQALKTVKEQLAVADAAPVLDEMEPVTTTMPSGPPQQLPPEEETLDAESGQRPDDAPPAARPKDRIGAAWSNNG